MQLFFTVMFCYGKMSKGKLNPCCSLGYRIHMNVLSMEAEGKTVPVEMITLHLASQFLAK